MADKERIEVLLTEYEQTSEEYRTRHQLLHNSYYLLVIGVLLFAGSALSISGNPLKLGLLFLAGSIAAFILGMAIMTHYIERDSAGTLRTRTERAVEQLSNDNVDHGLDIQRPLAIQRYVGKRNVTTDASGNMVERESDYSAIREIEIEPSAKALGQEVLGLSILMCLIGGLLLCTAIL